MNFFKIFLASVFFTIMALADVVQIDARNIGSHKNKLIFAMNTEMGNRYLSLKSGDYLILKQFSSDGKQCLVWEGEVEGLKNESLNIPTIKWKDKQKEYLVKTDSLKLTEDNIQSSLSNSNEKDQNAIDFQVSQESLAGDRTSEIQNAERLKEFFSTGINGTSNNFDRYIFNSFGQASVGQKFNTCNKIQGDCFQFKANLIHTNGSVDALSVYIKSRALKALPYHGAPLDEIINSEGLKGRVDFNSQVGVSSFISDVMVPIDRFEDALAQDEIEFQKNKNQHLFKQTLNMSTMSEKNNYGIDFSENTNTEKRPLNDNKINESSISVDYETITYKSNRSLELEQIRTQLLSSYIMSQEEKEIKSVGLYSLYKSDNSFFENQSEDGNIYLEVAKNMADLLSDFISVTSVPKDLYRLIIGKDILTGENLEPWERGFAAFGILSLGTSNVLSKGLREVVKISERFGTTTKVANEIFSYVGASKILSKIKNNVLIRSKDTNRFLANQVRYGERILGNGKNFTQDDLIRISKSYDDLFRNIDKVTPTQINTQVWRAVPETIKDRAGKIIAKNSDETVFNFHQGIKVSNGRYSAPGDSALYTSMGQKTDAWQTVLEELGDHANQNLILNSKHYKLDKVLDLTDPNTRKILGISEDMITKKNGDNVYELTHQLGGIAKQKGFQAIKAPSAPQVGGVNLIIFGD